MVAIAQSPYLLAKQSGDANSTRRFWLQQYKGSEMAFTIDRSRALDTIARSRNYNSTHTHTHAACLKLKESSVHCSQRMARGRKGHASILHYSNRPATVDVAVERVKVSIYTRWCTRHVRASVSAPGNGRQYDRPRFPALHARRAHVCTYEPWTVPRESGKP